MPYTELSLALRKINNAWRQIIAEALKGTGITYNDREILQLIAKIPGASKKFLSEELSGGYQQNITRSLQRLETQGLLKRKSNPDDKRSLCYFLTAEGEASVHRLAELMEKVWQKKLASFSEKEVEQLAHMLTEMAQNIAN